MELVMMKLKDSPLSRAAIQFWNLVELLLFFSLDSRTVMKLFYHQAGSFYFIFHNTP